MGENITEMRARHKKEIEELQVSCVHNELSDWMEHWWAIGHSSGFMVKVCENCGETVHTKRGCHICGKELIDDEAVAGDGIDSFYGCYYCRECFNDGDPKSIELTKLVKEGE